MHPTRAGHSGVATSFRPLLKMRCTLRRRKKIIRELIGSSLFYHRDASRLDATFMLVFFFQAFTCFAT